jgi:hypothetical protein
VTPPEQWPAEPAAAEGWFPAAEGLAEPQYAEPQYAEPQYAERQYAGDGYPDPGYGEPYAAPADARAPRPSALVAALAVAVVLAVAGWGTAAVALTRDGRAPAAVGPAPGTATTPEPAAGPVLAEDPCRPARGVAEERNLSGLHSQRSTTADGTESELRLRARCVLSADEISFTAEVLRSGDAGEVRESFEFHRDSADGTVRTLPGLGREASVATRVLASSGRTTLTLDTRADGVAVSITGTTSGDYAAADAEELLVATARAYLTAR